MKKTISILLAACAALTSCESFLDREPVAEVGSGDYFKVGSINSIFYFLHKAAEPFNCLEQDNLA